MSNDQGNDKRMIVGFDMRRAIAKEMSGTHTQGIASMSTVHSPIDINEEENSDRDEKFFIIQDDQQPLGADGKEDFPPRMLQHSPLSDRAAIYKQAGHHDMDAVWNHRGREMVVSYNPSTTGNQSSAIIESSSSTNRLAEIGNERTWLSRLSTSCHRSAILRIVKFVWIGYASLYMPQVWYTSQMIWRFEFGPMTRTHATNENDHASDDIGECRTDCCNKIVPSTAAKRCQRKETTHCREAPLRQDLSASVAEKLAAQVSAVVEYDFIRKNLPHAGVKTILPTNDYSHLEQHLDLLRDRLLSRGLEYISSDVVSSRSWVSVQNAENCYW